MRNNKQLRKYDQFANCDDLEKESRFTNSDGSIKTDEFISNWMELVIIVFKRNS